MEILQILPEAEVIRLAGEHAKHSGKVKHMWVKMIVLSLSHSHIHTHTHAHEHTCTLHLFMHLLIKQVDTLV